MSDSINAISDKSGSKPIDTWYQFKTKSIEDENRGNQVNATMAYKPQHPNSIFVT